MLGSAQIYLCLCHNRLPQLQAASIVGHASLHPDDVIAQTRETVANIEAVLAEANRLVGQPKFDLSSLYYKVYVRHAADLEQIRNELAHCVGDALKAVYLQADVCRQDLLLEIEATAGHPLAMMWERGRRLLNRSASSFHKPEAWSVRIVNNRSKQCRLKPSLR